MKILKITLLGILAIVLNTSAFAINYVSAGSGPWETNTTWSPVGIPTLADNVTIVATHQVTVSVVGNKCGDLTVNGQLRWLANVSVTVQGNYSISATGSESGTGVLQFNPPGTTITCLGTSSSLVYYSFYSNRTITAGSVINKAFTFTKIMDNRRVTNLGTYSMGNVDARTGSTFTNGATGTLSLKYSGFMAGRTFNAHAVGNTVNILYATGALPTPTAGYSNLAIASTTSGIKTLPSATIVGNNLTINSLNTLNSNGFDLSVGGNWSNSGAFTQGVRTVTLNGTGAQSIGGTANTTFFNLVKSGAGTATMTRAEVVSNLLTISNGVFSTGTFALTGAGGLTQTNGEFQVGRITATVPELAGTYTLSGGKITFNGAGAQTIRSGVTYSGVDITGSGTKTLAAATSITGSLLISSTLDVSATSFALNVGGNWTNNGTFTQRVGTVTWNGTVSQGISGTSLSTFENLTLNNTAGANITSGTYAVNGVLTLNNGNLNTNGNTFTLTSTATQTARIAQLAGTGSMSGNFVVQRFITTRDTTWADLSAPVQATTFNDWDNDLPAISYNYAPPTQYPTQYTYSEPLDDFVPITSAGTAITPGRGYEVFLAGNFSYANLPNTTIDAVGVPNQGNQNLSSLISFSGAGSNLVGNPFASSISWSTVRAASSRLLNTYDVYDFASGNYASFGLGTEIGSGQGFWVYSTGGGPTLIINENAKTTSSNSSLRSAVIQPYFTLKLSSNDLNNNFFHTLKVAADNVSSDGWDENDHPYHKSPNKLAPTLVSLADGKKLTTNTFSLSNDSYSMPIQTSAGISGYYKLEAAGFENISDYTCIKLEDRLLNQTVVLTAEHPYAFQLNVGDEPNRFVVHFSKDQNCKSSIADQKEIAQAFENAVNIFPSAEGNLITFNLEEATAAMISVTNVLGQAIVESMAISVKDQSVNVMIPQDFSGMYIVKIESSKGVITKKFVRK